MSLPFTLEQWTIGRFPLDFINDNLMYSSTERKVRYIYIFRQRKPSAIFRKKNQKSWPKFHRENYIRSSETRILDYTSMKHPCKLKYIWILFINNVSLIYLPCKHKSAGIRKLWTHKLFLEVLILKMFKSKSRFAWQLCFKK